MTSEDKIKKSFQKVREDIQEINNKINRTNNSISNVKENTQDWLLTVMQRQNKIEEQLNSIVDRIHALESQLAESKR